MNRLVKWRVDANNFFFQRFSRTVEYLSYASPNRVTRSLGLSPVQVSTSVIMISLLPSPSVVLFHPQQNRESTTCVSGSQSITSQNLAAGISSSVPMTRTSDLSSLPLSDSRPLSLARRTVAATTSNLSQRCSPHLSKMRILYHPINLATSLPQLLRSPKTELVTLAKTLLRG